MAALKTLRGKRGYARTYWCQECNAFHITTKQKTPPYDRSKEKRKLRKNQRKGSFN